MRSFCNGLILTTIFLTVTGASAEPDDPSYGTSDPPNYRKKKPAASESRYVYPQHFNDPYYGTGNPPGYNERRAREMGREYVPVPRAPRWSDPSYGTGDPSPRGTTFRQRWYRR